MSHRENDGADLRGFGRVQFITQNIFTEYLLCAKHKAAHSWGQKDSWFPQRA